ncbi:type VII secretion target [Amycolatopsis benzoatilytica]|uniref:type VII secretion target n=1 Tax=Amycolatopsis benzoatilytica TaxID=346045 RepID=UPI0003A7C0D6|nr:type VII secretion target [Amycolatopsis benzoatilytica]
MTGFGVTTDAMGTFATHLDQLEESLQSSGDLVGSCVADPGIFGIFGGQIFGAGASMHCAKARDHLHDYSGNLKKFSDAVHDAAKKYAEGDQAAESAITDAGKGIEDVKA